MTLNELIRDLQAGRVQPLYAVIGTNAPARSQVLALLREHVCPGDLGVWNLQEVDGSQTVGSAIATMASTAPFMGERRLIVVHGFDLMPLPEQEALLAGLPSTESVVVVLAASVDKRTKAGQALTTKAVVVSIEEPKAEGLAPWVMDYARQQGINFTPAAAQALVDIAGTDSGFLAQEVAKFATYLQGKGSVSEQLVTTLAAHGESEPAQFAVFRLTEAMVEGRTAPALTQLEELLAAGEPGLRLLAMIARQYRLLLAAKAWQADGVAAAARALGMKPFPVEKLFAQARKLSIDDVQRGLERILQADLALKSGLDPAGTLRMLTVDLCTFSGCKS